MIDHEKIDRKRDDVMNDISKAHALLIALESDCRQLADAVINYNREDIKQNPYIVKTVIRHIANGVNKQDAVLQTAKELSLNTERVEILFRYQKRFMSALLLFSRKYTAEKMKAAGYTAKQISAVLGVSENHIYKLLKAVHNEWILFR